MATCLIGQSCVLIRKWLRADRYFNLHSGSNGASLHIDVELPLTLHKPQSIAIFSPRQLLSHSYIT